MSLAKLGIDLALVPQDPFLPLEAPAGPVFLDTGACLCALQKPGTEPRVNASVISESAKSRRDVTDVAWQCIGNQTQGVYNASTGKWFLSAHGGDKWGGLPVYDASNPPDTKKTVAWNERTESLRSLESNKGFSVYDQGCTGKNSSAFSTSYYQALEQLRQQELPVAAAPCWRPGAFPMQLQGVESWEKKGCGEGFLCMSTILASLPGKY